MSLLDTSQSHNIRCRHFKPGRWYLSKCMWCQSINQSTQSINKSVNQSTNRSINQLFLTLFCTLSKCNIHYTYTCVPLHFNYDLSINIFLASAIFLVSISSCVVDASLHLRNGGCSYRVWICRGISGSWIVNPRSTRSMPPARGPIWSNIPHFSNNVSITNNSCNSLK